MSRSNTIIYNYSTVMFMSGRKQHYIPQWFLRNFVIEEDFEKDNKKKRVFRLNKKTGDIDKKKINQSFYSPRFLEELIDDLMSEAEDKVAKFFTGLEKLNFQTEKIKIYNPSNRDNIFKKSLDIKKFAETFIDAMHLQSNFEILCDFINHLTFRTPSFRNYMKFSKILDFSFISTETQEILYQSNIKYDEVFLQKAQGYFLKNDLQGMISLISKNISIGIKKSLDHKDSQIEIENKIREVLQKLPDETVDKPLKHTELRPIIIINLSGLNPQDHPVELITSDNPLIIAELIVNGVSVMLEYYIPINPTIAIGLLNLENFMKYITNNLSTIDNKTPVEYSIFVKSDIIHRLNQTMYDNSFEYLAAHNEDTLQHIKKNNKHLD